MRVLESTTPSPYNMGKKKHRLRKQSRENEPGMSDSSEEGQGGPSSRTCRHLNKAVNFGAMKKALKQMGPLGECTTCTKETSKSSGAASVSDGDALLDEAETTVWLCLQCGHQGCDRNSQYQHSLKHYQTPRSVSHCVVVNLTTWVVWCYDCDDEVEIAYSKKLEESVEFLRKQAGALAEATSGKKSSLRCDTPQGAEAASDTTLSEESKSQQTNKVKGGTPTAGLAVPQLVKVKGLSNLGNTCFFNAVMQNLSQTHELEGILSERIKKGLVLTLGCVPGDEEEEDEESESEEEEIEEENMGKRVKPEPLTVSLTEGGALTQSMLSFLRDMNSTTKNSVISPGSLFGQVCKKAPRFKGFQQQDSHELLRHLLDGMRTEEVKRAQQAILSKFNINSTTSKKLDDDTKQKVKEYGRHAKQTFVDSLFGGQLISTVLCEECQTPSQIFESFLDLSLPIMEEKASRPNSGWFPRKKESFKTEKKEEKTSEMSEHKAMDGFALNASKHQTKKHKKQQKRQSRLKKNKVQPASAGTAETEAGAEEGNSSSCAAAVPPSEEQEKEDTNSNDEDISDADVEDNLESDASRNRFKALNIEDENNEDAKPIIPENAGNSDTADITGSENKHVINGNIENRDLIDYEGQSLSASSSNQNLQGESLCGSNTPSEGTLTLSGSNTSEATLTLPDLPLTNGSMEYLHMNGANEELCIGGAAVDENRTGSSIESLTKKMEQVSLNGTACKMEEVDSAETQQIENGSQINGDWSGMKGDENNDSMVQTGCKINNITDMQSKTSAKIDATEQEPTTKNAKNKPSKKELRKQVLQKSVQTLVERYIADPHECSVLSCLNQFTAAELLTGNNKFGCDFCKKQKQKSTGKKEMVYTNASKQLLIFQPPAVLTLHLKRFQQFGFSLRKVNRHVDFPLVLDLAPYCSAACQGIKPGQKQILYSLYGVVEHSGRLTGGHYTAYVKVRPNTGNLKDFLHQNGANPTLPKVDFNEEVKNTAAAAAPETEIKPPQGRWFYVSDSRVSEVSESSILKSQAYLLFYERIY